MRKILFVIACCAIMMVSQRQVAQAEAVTLAENVAQEAKVEYAPADTRIIPDKYNTGCKGELTTLVMDTENPMWVNDIRIVYSGAGEKFVLDFGYRNKDKSGTLYIENYDFSSHPFAAYNENKADVPIKVVFNNCKFSRITFGRDEGNMSYEFNNCSMISFYGSNTVLNRCKFGGSYVDGIVPFADVEVNDCFFSEMTGVATEGNVHIDGTQIYGHANNLVYDVSYNNCRFEMPSLRLENSNAYVNACIMLSLEYNSAKELSFNNCIVNGGGYAMYAGAKSEEFTFENVSFDGIRFGAAAMYGVVYPNPNQAIKMSNVEPTDLLYIGSVWKENGETHFSVTNDTKRERTLLIYTDKGVYTHTIPACPQITKDNCTQFLYEDMPFDIDIVVPADCQYAVCFDHTIEGFGTQIRFVNWSGGEVYLPEDIVNTVHSGKENDILLSGECGKNITFTLTNTGILTLSGTGDTYNYHSTKFPEWIDYIDYIKEIRVEEGIEGLGSMIFRKCNSVKKVSLPDTLTTIGQYAFGGCVSLEEFILPANITTLGKYVFSGTILQEIHYAGYSWNEVELGDGNDNLVERLVYDKEKPYHFVDVPVNKDDWKYISTNYVFQRELMVGVNEVMFAPDVNMERSMLVQILYSMEKKPEVVYQDVFMDVAQNAWYSSAVIWAANNGITAGVGDGRFGSNEGLTREQQTVFLYKYAQLKGYEVSQRAELDAFTDYKEVSDWATEAMQWAVSVGILAGKPQDDGSRKLDPQATSSRVECAAMMRKFYMEYVE